MTRLPERLLDRLHLLSARSRPTPAEREQYAEVREALRVWAERRPWLRAEDLSRLLRYEAAAEALRLRERGWQKKMDLEIEKFWKSRGAR